MKLFLKISFVACMIAGLFVAVLVFKTAPAGESLAYYIGWWIGAIMGGFVILGMPICAISGILILIHNWLLGEKKEEASND
jgi:hypothetical protein